MSGQEHLYHDYAVPDPPHQPLYLEAILGYLAAPGDVKTILDAGCGDGHFSASLAQAGYTIFGIDQSAGGIRQALARQLPNASFQVASVYDDFRELFGGSREFDAIVSVEVIEHLYDPRRFVRRTCESLRPGGLVIVTTPYWGYLKNVVLAVTGRLDRALSALWDGGHIKHWSYRTLRTLFEEQPFEFVAFRGAGTPDAWLMEGNDHGLQKEGRLTMSIRSTKPLAMPHVAGRMRDNEGADAACRRPLRVTFLVVMPAPYMVDLFDAMHRDPRFCISVLFMEKPAVAAPGVYWREKPIPSYATVLPGGWFWFIRARVHVNVGLLRALDRDRPDFVVVMGYHGLTCQFAMYWLWTIRIPWAFWGEVPGMNKRSRLGAALRWLALRPVACLADGIAGIGARARAAYAKLSKRRQPVWNIPYYCPIQTLLDIERDSSAARPVAHFLYCGQLVARKGVDLLVPAFCRLAREHPDVRLTLVGDGPLRERLADSVPEPIRQRVTWAGFKEMDELPPYFAAANVFVLPSLHDGWGVVINQAVSAGMAIIASDAVGAAVDLVETNTNGIVFPARDEAALTAALRFFVDRPECIAIFGRASRQRAAALAPSEGVERWLRFIETIRQRRCPR